MRLITAISAVLMMLALTLAMPMARAAGAPAEGDMAAAADAAAVRDFKLTDAFLQKYLAVKDDVAKDPCGLGMIDLLKGMSGQHKQKSLDHMIAHYDAKPGVHTMLASHGLSAREMVVGTLALFLAAMQDLATKHPEMVSGKGSMSVSAANMAFYRQHKAEIHRHMQELGRQQLQANGGELPACFTQ